MADDDLLRMHFVSFSIQTLLQGIFFCTSVLFVYLTLRRRLHMHAALNKYGLVGVFLITAGVTALYDATFLANAAEADAYLADLSNPLFITKTYLFDFSVAIADLLFVHFTSSGEIDPSLSFLPFYYSQDLSLWDGESIFDMALKPRLVVIGILTISGSGKRGDALRAARSFVVFIESAGIFLFFTVLSLAVYLAGSTVVFIIIDCNIFFAGLAYMFINVRVALGEAHDGVPTGPSGLKFAFDLTQQATVLDLELGTRVE
ncbi:hypothetical protein GGF50DRAFT_92690 [Schizophyllum commune]